MTATRYGIGIDIEGAPGVVDLSAVGISQEPRGLWSEGEIVELSDGNLRALGLPTARWVWDYIGEDSRAALRVYCPGPSEEVYIQTVDNEGVWGIYRAVMRWPRGERTRAGWKREMRWDFEVEFLILEAAGEESY